MNGVEEITATKKEARAKYKEYRSALERQPYPWDGDAKEKGGQVDG